MVQNFFAKILLAPFALLYGLGVAIRNLLYQTGMLKGVQFNIPIVAIGNLTVGGTGKTPHIEFLVRLLKDYLEVGTLSRGYGRKSRGYLSLRTFMDAETAGDEPLQFKRKFPDIMVAVAESRALAIPRMILEQPGLQLVLLDDAFQHRAVIPGMNILLTDYQLPFTRDWLLPVGRLREWRSAYERADRIIVAKCPATLSTEQATALTREINPLPHQKMYFTYYQYGYPYYLFEQRYIWPLETRLKVLLVSGIARVDYLEEYLAGKVDFFKSVHYEDHHYYSHFDVSQLKRIFDNMEGKKIILTTEKDAMRLELHKQFFLDHRLPVFVLPVTVKFHFDQAGAFEQDIKDYLLNFKV